MQLCEADFRDIQGLVRFGYGHLNQARFYLLEIVDAAKARDWIRSSIGRVTTAVPDKEVGHALQIAFTCEGLRKLGVAGGVLKKLSLEFRRGMVDPNRSRRLGDVDKNAPDHWAWGVPDRSYPHVLVLVYGNKSDDAASKDEFGAWNDKVKGESWSEAFREIYALTTVRKNDLEPFGFVDGVSQPTLDWSRSKPVRLRDTTEYTNMSALGEFLLGYPNEYGRYTDRPLLESDARGAHVLPLAEDKPGKRDFGRNGTYLVLRDLRQNVPGFRDFIEKRSGGDEEKAHALASAMSGRVPADQKIIPPWPRTPNGPPPWHAPGAVDDPERTIPPGGPINPISESAIEGVDPNKMQDVWLDQFDFGNDPDGISCPYGAHIRRANPRNADLPQGTRGLVGKVMRTLGFNRQHTHDDLLSSTRFHRILRRGRGYQGQPEDNAAAAGAPEQGLRFIALNANISRQFEFIQTSWFVNAKFSGLDEDDPLLGGRKPLMTGARVDRFTRPQDSGLQCRLNDVPQFVTVRGGAYFFMPGLSALRYIAGEGEANELPGREG
jgi:deferrochelatase/peroxidase EfeB